MSIEFNGNFIFGGIIFEVISIFALLLESGTTLCIIPATFGQFCQI